MSKTVISKIKYLLQVRENNLLLPRLEGILDALSVDSFSERKEMTF